MLADYKQSLFDHGAGPGDSPSWMPGGVFGGVPMGGGGKRRRLRKSKKMLKRKGGKKQMRKTKKYSRK